MRNNSVTSAWRIRNILERRWNLLLCFAFFQQYFARLFVTQQRRRNGRRLVRKVMNNGFEMLEKPRFSFDVRVNYVQQCSIFGQFCVLLSSSLKISFEKIFSGLKKILWTFSRYSSCFMWNVETEAALPVDRPWDFLCEAIVRSKMTRAFCEAAEQHEDRSPLF